MSRGSRPVRIGLSVAVAGAIGLTPAFFIASPASAAPGDLTIADKTGTEGSNLVFTLTREPDGIGATYTLTTSAGSATPGVDYDVTPNPTSVVFSGSDTTKTVSVHTIDDAFSESSETFSLSVALGGNPVVDGIGTIVDNDPVPSYTLTAAPTAVTEATNAKATITATLSAASGNDVTIQVDSVDGTAVAGADYNTLSTPIFIAAGARTGTADVTILNDGIKDQADLETFTVNGVGENVSPTNRSVQVGITDAQSAPVLTLSGGGIAPEGGNADFMVTANIGSEVPITVHWDVVTAPAQAGHGAASSSADIIYAPTRTVTIPAGESVGTISIPLISDGINELPEDFAVQLSAPENAVLGATSMVVSTITDGDSAPTVSITPTSATEGDTGRSTKTFTATLSAPSGRTVTVNWATAMESLGIGYARPGRDYLQKTGQLVFPAGVTTQPFTIDILGDKVDEGDGETFLITLTAVPNDTSVGVVGDTQVTITDDDLAPTITFDDPVAMAEGDTTMPVLLPLKVTGSSDHALTFTLTDTTNSNVPVGTASGDAFETYPGGDDYDLSSSTITIQPETTVGYGVFLLNGDMVYEPNETAYFTVAADGLTEPFLTAPLFKTAKVSILNDDAQPDLEINSVTGAEGDTVAVTGTVTGTSQYGVEVSVTFIGSSVNGTVAASVNDFTNPGAKSVVIAKEVDSGTVLPVANIVLTDDTTAEPAETIEVGGVGVDNIGTVTEGVITIAASDNGVTPPAPELTIYAPGNIKGAGSIEITGSATTSGSVVELWDAAWSDAHIAKIDEAISGVGGAYKFVQAIATGHRYAVRANGVWSSLVYTRIAQAPLLGLTSTSKGSLTIAVQGNPVGVGQSVIVQRWNPTIGAWTTASKGMTANAGRFTATITGLRSGSAWTFRAYIVGDGGDGILAGFSVNKQVVIK